MVLWYWYVYGQYIQCLICIHLLSVDYLWLQPCPISLNFDHNNDTDLSKGLSDTNVTSICTSALPRLRKSSSVNDLIKRSHLM